MDEEAAGEERETWRHAWCRTMSQAVRRSWAPSAGVRGSHDWRQHDASCEGC